MSNSKIDLCFCLDVTGSMGPYIQEAENKINTIADTIHTSAKLADPKDLHIAVVAYRDYYPQDFREYVADTVTGDFTPNVGIVKSNLGRLQAIGGGDGPEAVGTALHTALNNLTWRTGSHVHKILILITDAPPHGWDGKEPNKGLDTHDIFQMRREVIKDKINIFVVKCLPTMRSYVNAERFYDTFLTVLDNQDKSGKHLPNGATVALADASLLANAIIGLTLENKKLKDVIQDLIQQIKNKKTGGPKTKKIALSPLHEHLKLIANPTDLSNNEMSDAWFNASSVNDVADAVDQHIARAKDSVVQVKRLLADTEFSSVQTNIYARSPTSEDEHNANIWHSAKSVNDVKGLKDSNLGSVSTSQHLDYVDGPINDHQIMRLAAMYTEALDEEGLGDEEEEDEGEGEDDDE